MTALALAGTGGGSVAPDLVLPPRFDRVGDVRRFEQDRLPLPSGEPEASTCAADDDPCKGEGATPSPGTDERGPGLAPVERLGRIGLPGAVASGARGPYRCKACGELGHTRPSCLAARPLAAGDLQLRRLDLIPCTRCHLRGHVAGDPDRCLVYRGSFGLGGQAGQAADQASWSWAGRGARP